MRVRNISRHVTLKGATEGARYAVPPGFEADIPPALARLWIDRGHAEEMPAPEVQDYAQPDAPQPDAPETPKQLPGKPPEALTPKNKGGKP